MRIAAIVVNHNGGEDLPRCLAALAAQTVPVEAVLVDCDSNDGSEALAARPPAGVRGVPLGRNAGYAGGCNAGLAVTEADVVAFLNPDCFLAPEYSAVCTEVLGGEPTVGGVAGRLLRDDGCTLDSCGQVLTPFLLRVRDRGYGSPAAGAFERGDRVLAACGAGMVYRRAALQAAAVEGHVFPEEYFAFWEDLDLGWRVRNAGWDVRYEPRAVAVHRRAATAVPGRGRLIFRRPPSLAAGILLNRWATLARNLHAVDFALRLPVLLAGDVAMVAVIALRRPAAVPALLAGLPRVMRALRQRRALVQRRLGELR